MNTTLGIFVKRPIPGSVKTRLAAAIGDDAAARLYRAFVTDLANRFRGFASRRIFAITPNDEATRSEFEQLSAGDYEIWPQPTGSLGDRLLGFFEAFDHGPTIVIGSDSPTLPMSLVTEAVERLNRNQWMASGLCLLGPATDGGVYLIGIRPAIGSSSEFARKKLFDEVEWSTSRVCDQLCRQADLIGASLELLPPWFDVDEPEDLERLNVRGSPELIPADSPATRAVLDDFARR